MCTRDRKGAKGAGEAVRWQTHTHSVGVDYCSSKLLGLFLTLFQSPPSSQKRNHLRSAWPKDQQFPSSNSNNNSTDILKYADNAPAGTLIDQGIGNLYRVCAHFDRFFVARFLTLSVDKGPKANFYLYSHHAIIGTSRPTHYVVLEDELKLCGHDGQYARTLNGDAACYLLNIPTGKNVEPLARFLFLLAHLHQVRC